MQRYFLKEDMGKLNKEDSHHIINVMRMKTGDKIIVCYLGNCYLAEIKLTGKDIFYKKISPIESAKSNNITIMQGLLKKDKNEFVIKYGTLFGASNIIFTPFKRTIKKNFDFKKYESRFYKIAKDASQTARLNKVPNILYYKNFNEVDFNKYHNIILFYENCKDTNLDFIKNIKKNHEILIIIGPEGGFEENEIEYFKKKKVMIKSLGENILTAESASLSALSIIRYLI